MRTAANGQIYSLVARELDGGHDISDILASHDRTGPPINHPVVNLSGSIVSVIVNRNGLTMNPRAQFFECPYWHVFPSLFSGQLSHIARGRSRIRKGRRCKMDRYFTKRKSSSVCRSVPRLHA